MDYWKCYSVVSWLNEFSKFGQSFRNEMIWNFVYFFRDTTRDEAVFPVPQIVKMNISVIYVPASVSVVRLWASTTGKGLISLDNRHR